MSEKCDSCKYQETEFTGTDLERLKCLSCFYLAPHPDSPWKKNWEAKK